MVESFQKNSVKNIGLGGQLLWKGFLKIQIFEVLYFLRICPIFVGCVHNFGRSDRDIFNREDLRFLKDLCHGKLFEKKWNCVCSAQASPGIIFWKGKTCFESVDKGDAIICFYCIIFETSSKMLEIVMQLFVLIASYFKHVQNCLKIMMQ